MHALLRPLGPLLLLAGLGCGGEGRAALDVDFEIPRTEAFAPTLSDYGLFAGPMSALQPAEDTHVYALSAELFTDYAGKQRLIRLPEGGTVGEQDGRLTYPEATLLAKTFYFDADLRDPSRGRRIIETRLLVKRAGQWNVATYVWNAAQTDAVLSLEGSTAEVGFVDRSGQWRETAHEIPSEAACVTCHQRDGVAVFIGPELENLDREVTRGGQTVNQLDDLTAQGVLPAIRRSGPTMVDPYDETLPLDVRARSYLDVNCAHCHRPEAWARSAEQGLDLRYETPLADTGIRAELRSLRRQIESGEMPFLGTTLLHDEGVALLLAYLDTL